jgi:site-specific recombinase XerD
MTDIKLANDGQDTRVLQHYMGHKNIMHTVRYTEMAPDRFRISGKTDNSAQWPNTDLLD